MTWLHDLLAFSTFTSVECAKALIADGPLLARLALYTLLGLSPVLLVMELERRDLRRLQADLDREDEREMGGPLSDPPDEEALRALLVVFRR